VLFRSVTKKNPRHGNETLEAAMGEAAVAAAPERRTGGKSHLCKFLNWSRMKLERRLEGDAAFPVEKRGTRAGGWVFDFDAITAYLQPEGEPEAPATPEPAAPTKFGHSGEETARQRRDAAQAQLLEDKIKRSRGELVEVAELRMALAEGVARMASGFNKLPETLARRLNLPDSAIPVIRQELDDARRHLVTSMRNLKVDAKADG
jgi:phage terminase Nu1 subunit (DNA packaging protein)